MISLDVKSEAKSASQSPLSITSQSSDESPVSFSDLLKGVSDKKDSKTIQNGALLLSLDANEQSIVTTKDAKGTGKLSTLLSLLKSEEVVESDEPIELHPKLTQALSTKEIKLLVKEAKDYLKQKIESSDDYKQSQIKELPKTLKGLALVAKKLDIDVSKITVEEVQVKSKVPEFKNLLVAKEIVEEKLHDKPKTSHVKELLAAKDTKTGKKTEVNVQVKTDEKVAVKDIKSEVKVHAKADEKTEIKAQVKTDEKVEVKAQVQPEIKDTKSKTKPAINMQSTQVQEHKEEKISLESKEIKQTPLFKAKTVVEHTTTEQIVQVKTNVSTKIEAKTPKDKADETLKLLLRGEKPSLGLNMTADFSVATAKVIAPSATTEVSKSLEQMLHGESSESHQTNTKTETITAHKANDFEVKLNEAKQLIKYLSADVKTAIDDYKSPFTRIKVQLNPQKLGEVDLTIVQRGKNLHVNISSNNSAINTLSMNANDLKVQLSNNGINNASLNFNNNSQNGEQAGQQQQNRQNERQEAHEEYNFFENEEANEEIISSLEIVVPQYG